MNIDDYNDPAHHAVGGKWSAHPADIARNFPAARLAYFAVDILDSLPTNVWPNRVGGNNLTFPANLVDTYQPGWEISAPPGAGQNATATFPTEILGLFPFGIVTASGANSAGFSFTFGRAGGTPGAHIKLAMTSTARGGLSQLHHMACLNPTPVLATTDFTVTASLLVDTSTTVNALGELYMAGRIYDDGTSATTVATGDRGGSVGVGVVSFAGLTAESKEVTLPTSASNSIRQALLFMFATRPDPNLLKLATSWMASADAYENGWIYPGLAGVV